MASESIEKQRYTESKVYTRKAFKSPKSKAKALNAVVPTTTTVTTTNNEDENNTVSVTAITTTVNLVENNVKNVSARRMIPVDGNSAQLQVNSRLDVVSNVLPVKPVLDNGVKISLGLGSKQEKRELRRKLERELDLVRRWVNKFEDGNSTVLVASTGAKGALSEVASTVVLREPTRVAGFPRDPNKAFNKLSMPILENNHGVSGNVEKEKRTPKANQFYLNSEFLLAKDRFPPAESNKKSKLSGKKRGGGEIGNCFGTDSKYFKSCSSLLEKLMKHKHGWVFNTPVDVKGLGLHDYLSIITHPMDLGTVNSRLNNNWYNSPKEFAEDVRLTFRNAMTYNPKGQDVHVMAELLSKLFEEKWAIVESNYDRKMTYGIDYGAATPTPSSLSRKAHSAFQPPARTPAPEKPKLRDPLKRDMTYEEKQKLSANLQNLPSEKLDAVVQIIKRSNSALSHNDDEIEVDIDSVDVETLWELDRFVTNYKKSLSKQKRKAELGLQPITQAEQNSPHKSQTPAVVELMKEKQADGRNDLLSLPSQVEIQVNNGSKSSSSSSVSGPSSSDSDSDSSSASGSDAA
ncbi:hypothetical protein Lal_00045390 [Lupinus albus]|uniref:Putative chromatin remodeler Bromodomain family n=1 Tax=Lupinus albus TaxID=3870 RepID=A0A6A5NSK2_LUPAL|nr:putative chromatin remodeler Bromodomain family [Lupinus albus]KAF1886160.1 hypothetical protein Lal_00045390 [Lupinus albus]